MAFLTLFRVATGDNWNGIMKVSDVLFFWHCGIVAAYVSSLSHFCFELTEVPQTWLDFGKEKGKEVRGKGGEGKEGEKEGDRKGRKIKGGRKIRGKEGRNGTRLSGGGEN